ncbi:MAG TPA: alkaline phosphatase family protein [Candidatus Dormibacteraeota bacterium]|jgi:phospholipase C|nr:alkaline phosphatase family protein [Candidatus Dormibacteraeota bacterium]
MPKSVPSIRTVAGQKVQRVVIILKENHTFDNYFGTFPGVEGASMPRSPNPPLSDPNHRHSAWLTRKTTAIRQQFVEADIPAYFAYARKFTLCDHYFTDVAGPSTPNHLMLVAADSPLFDNPSHGDQTKLSKSLPASLDKSGISWGNYGGYAFQFLSGIKTSSTFSSDQFKVDASGGTLPSVSWVFAPSEFDEHPPDPQRGRMGNVTSGSQWTVDQINAIVGGGLWSSTAIFITWDDWGGWWDHVDPPNVETWNLATPQPNYKGTQFRYGSRVGCIVLGPYAKNSYISRTLHSHVSLVKFVETLFNIPPLNPRDANADSMSDCFDFNQKPSEPPSTNP